MSDYRLFSDVSARALEFLRSAPVAAVLAAACVFANDPALAQSVIHRCTDPGGGIVFSQLPCPKDVSGPSGEENADAEPDATDTQSDPVTVTATDDASNEERGTEAERAACRKRHRDAIDVIDAEIGRDYSPDRAADYKRRLLALTAELRRC